MIWWWFAKEYDSANAENNATDDRHDEAAVLCVSLKHSPMRQPGCPFVVFHIFSCNQQIPSGSCAYIILWTNRGLYVMPVIFIRFGWFVDAVAKQKPKDSEYEEKRNIHFRSNGRDDMVLFFLFIFRYFWRKWKTANHNRRSFAKYLCSSVDFNKNHIFFRCFFSICWWSGQQEWERQKYRPLWKCLTTHTQAHPLDIVIMIQSFLIRWLCKVCARVCVRALIKTFTVKC